MFNRLMEYLESIELLDYEVALIQAAYGTAFMASGWYGAAWLFG